MNVKIRDVRYIDSIWRRLLRANPEGGVSELQAAPKEDESIWKAAETYIDTEFVDLFNGTKNKLLPLLENSLDAKNWNYGSEFWVLVGWQKSQIDFWERYTQRSDVILSGNARRIISDRIVWLVLQYYRYK